MRRPRRNTILFLLVVGLIVASGWETDYRSCERQQPIRAVLHANVAASIRAHLASARNEARTDPVQAVIDRRIAANLARNIRQVDTLDCDRLIPG